MCIPRVLVQGPSYTVDGIIVELSVGGQLEMVDVNVSVTVDCCLVLMVGRLWIQGIRCL